MEALLSRETVITLAILGGIASVLASLLQSAGKLSARNAMYLNWAGYGFMLASMTLFVVLGMRGAAH